MHVFTLRAPAGCGAEVLRLRGQLPPELAVERVVVGRVELRGDSLRLVHHSLPAGLDRRCRSVHRRVHRQAHAAALRAAHEVRGRVGAGREADRLRVPSVSKLLSYGTGV